MKESQREFLPSYHSIAMLKPIGWPIIVFLALIFGCAKDEPANTDGVVSRDAVKSPAVEGCLGCHPMRLDSRHDFACEDCHAGDPKVRDQEVAHAGFISQPAHPDHMADTCGKCHAAIVAQATRSLHFTVADEINLVRQAFGAKERLASLNAIPQQEAPTNRLQLADDLLRRRCLRCHLYTAGDTYAGTHHGTGCAACHLAFSNGSVRDHRFLARPTDLQCLGCHYGNRVGADYYGRFEQDINWDYRTPFQAKAKEERQPYGVGFHQLSPDLHQEAGMTCIDCHSGLELMVGGTKLSCLSCHDSVLGSEVPKTLTETDGHRQLTMLANGKRLEVPVMKDLAHELYGQWVACQVCHGQWSFADHGNHLLRQDSPDYEPWQALTRQGNAEVETKFEAALSQGTLDRQPTMVDGITGGSFPGVWLQAYEFRRWEEMSVCLNSQGVLHVCRPILDMHLSYVNSDNEVVFDSVPPDTKIQVMQPYTPHTTGRAGAFYLQRIQGISLP